MYLGYPLVSRQFCAKFEYHLTILKAKSTADDSVAAAGEEGEEALMEEDVVARIYLPLVNR